MKIQLKLTSVLAFLILLQSGYSQKIDIYSRPIQHEPSRNFDVLHYKVQLTFDLDKKEFQGSNTITLSPLTENFQTFALNATDLRIAKAVTEQGQELPFTHDNDTLRISLFHPVSFGDTIKVTVWYHGTDPKKGLYFDEKTSRHPMVVTTDSWPDEARYWFPCYDYPHDKAVQEMIITVKNPHKVLSNGKFMGVTENKQAGTWTWHYYQERPHSTYLSMLAIGPYTVIEDSLESLPVNYWVYPDDDENANWIFEDTPAMIAFFNRIYDYPYPWDKYDQVVSPRQGGGAEATSATILGEGVIYDRRAEQDFSWERVIAHEIAHQWWGDLITLRSWEHTWMNEGFGTYSDYLYTNFARGGDEGAVDLLGKKNQYLREAHNRYMRPIVFTRYNKPQDNFDSHTYPKAAVVLHMLRFILGDKSFFETLSYFLHRHSFKAVDTHDFMTAVKEVTGQNLDWFFDQFIFKPGHPVFDISYNYDNILNQINLTVRQVQDTSKGVPVYRIPVQIGIVTDGGKETKKIWLSKTEETFSIPSPTAPLLVRFDDGNHLLKEWTFRKTVTELLYQAMNDDVIGRQWAAAQLAEFSSDKRVIRILSRIAKEDPFWAVRKQATETLGKVSSGNRVNLFKELTRDSNSQVRTAALNQLGETNDKELLPFFKNCFEKDDSYLAQAAALQAIGKCGSKSDLPFLEKAILIESPRNILKRAAEQAMKNIEAK